MQLDVVLTVVVEKSTGVVLGMGQLESVVESLLVVLEIVVVAMLFVVVEVVVLHLLARLKIKMINRAQLHNKSTITYAAGCGPISQ